MSAIRIRSKTGCLTCKNRRKKCDETRPICARCTKAGMTCLGYSYLDDPSRKVPRIRPKAGQPDAGQTDARSRLSQSHTARVLPDSSVIDPFASGTLSSDPMFPTTVEDDFQRLLDGSMPDGILANEALLDFSFPSPELFSSGAQLQHEPSTQYDVSHLAGPSHSAPFPSSLPTASSSGPSTPLVSANNARSQSGPTRLQQAKLFGTLWSLAQSLTSRNPQPPVSAYLGGGLSPNPQAPTQPSPDITEDDESGVTEDSDPEGVKALICGTPALDPTVQSNSLPFVLQSYAAWMTNMVFEPLRLAPRLKNWITTRYTFSEDTRKSVTMFAGLLNAMWKQGVDAGVYMKIAALLGKRVRNRVREAQLRLELGLEGESVSETFDEALEMTALLSITSPSRLPYELLEETAPLFRRACPEPPGEPIDLPSKFIHPDVNLRHFAVMDILMNACVCRPMLFQYTVKYDPELCHGTFSSHNKGLQWLNGIPDHIIFLLARMNMLWTEFGSRADPAVVSGIRHELQNFQPHVASSTDAYLKIARLAVQECWRLAALVYLYMGLCGANAGDPRVEKVYKSFMRLLEGTKPGRTPDAFLIGPILLAGVASRLERERDVIRGRVLAVRECSTPGSAGNDVVWVLNDIWARSNVEGRDAVWDDLRIAYLKVWDHG